jgi:hypothetical protein
MYKRIHYLLVLLCLSFLEMHGQVYVDPAVAAATGVHAGIINSQLDQTNDNLTLIERGQLAVTGQLLIANDLQREIYRGLSEVAGAVRSLLAIREIADIGIDIVQNVEKAVDLASSDPLLLLFAERGARDFRTRASNLAAEVGAFVLKGGRGNLMDSGERAKLLNTIRMELTIIRGIAYGMYRSMFWAQQRGIWNSLNPYASFVNIDRRLADNILSNSKLVKR